MPGFEPLRLGNFVPAGGTTGVEDVEGTDGVGVDDCGGRTLPPGRVITGALPPPYIGPPHEFVPGGATGCHGPSGYAEPP